MSFCPLESAFEFFIYINYFLYSSLGMNGKIWFFGLSCTGLKDQVYAVKMTLDLTEHRNT